jgi:CheY-like chemotaxis protein
MTSVLVADDSPSVRKLLRMIFHAEYQLIEAGDGLEALRQIVAERPQVAILDVAMPGLNGLDLCRAIRQDARIASTAIIVITANGGPADHAAAMAAGADHFVAKPFSPATMLRLVASVLVREPITFR